MLARWGPRHSSRSPRLYFIHRGALAGCLADRFAPRVIVAVGAAILGSGLCLTAAADRIWLCYLAYGIGVGIGGACCYMPSLAIVGGWFIRRRNTALGVAAAGTGCGTMVFPPLAAELIQRYDGVRPTSFLASPPALFSSDAL